MNTSGEIEIIPTDDGVLDESFTRFSEELLLSSGKNERSIISETNGGRKPI